MSGLNRILLFLPFSCYNRRMFPPFPQEKAAKALEKTVRLINEGKIKVERLARESEERKNQEIMLGALVCKAQDGKEVTLLANSGNAKAIKTSGPAEIDGEIIFVPSIVSAAEIERALSENDREIHGLTEKINKRKSAGDFSDSADKDLRNLRERLCLESLEKVHALYNFHCIDGKIRSLKEICAEYNKGKFPPTGTGDCCAPKLLDYAFSHGLEALSLAEIKLPQKNKALPDNLVPPCDERCGILLPAMLGLRILYRDDAICVVNKQAGLLSVPGRTEDKKDCAESRLKRLFGEKVEIAQSAAHRLDMETSGVMILAFTKDARRNLSRQFEEKTIEKEYIALLDGVLPKKGIAARGQMELFFRLDIENRPHQIWDKENGKSAVTEWEILGVERHLSPDGGLRNVTRVLFRPRTGRTHQLRLASSDSHGFGVPIVGDSLYGRSSDGERLMLHARKITFTHPVTGERMSVGCDAEF